jgi:hypothetical protein
MDKTKQRIKIAEIGGYSDVKSHFDYINLVRRIDGVFLDNPPEFRTEIPDYLNNTNMIKWVIKQLSYEEQIEWTHHLGEALGWENPNDWTYLDMILAPAEKWCEALLKMKGLWDEE